MSNEKTLVVYFSRADENYSVGTVEVGNTELLAKEIIAKTGSDEFKIEPKDKYPAVYQEAIERATAERKTNARPEYVGDVDIANYDTIFFGYPIWWGDMPMIVYNFLEKHVFTGKNFVPFCTHEGSGESGTFAEAGNLAVGANVEQGLAIQGKLARQDGGKKQVGYWIDQTRV